MKRCNSCKQEKPLDHFGKHKRMKDGLYTKCKVCHNKSQKEYYKNNIGAESAKRKISYLDKRNEYLERARKNRYKRLYGITIEQYNEKLSQQDYKCAICKAEQSLYKSRFAVDHSHVSGKTRGLLCFICNIKICGIIDKRAKSKNVNLSEFELVSNIFEYYKKANEG